MKKLLILVIGAGLAGGLAARAQAPVLTSLSPVRNALSAARTSAVVLSFSEPMSAGAASGAAVKVFSRQRGGLLTRAGGGGTFSGAGTNTISFQPAQPFRPGEVVTVVTTPAATSAAGAALAVPHVYQFTAKAGVGPAVFVPDSFARSSASPFGVKLGDVDGDGDLDLLMANPSFGSISIRRNDGTGHFGGGSEITGINAALQLELADADGDGDLDVFAADFGPYPAYDGDEVEVYRNDGTGNFTLLERVPVLPGVYTLTLADVDADGDVDIVAPANWFDPTATTPSPYHVAVRFNDGTGHFNPAGPELATGYIVATVATGDIDGDGDLDLLTPSADSARAVGVWLNGGPGIFVHAADVRGTVPFQAVLADMDADGDLDLLSCAAGGEFSLHRNDGTGAFGSGTRTLLPNTQLDQLIAPDLDGDGDLDVVIADAFHGNLLLLFNDGFGTLTGPSVLPAGPFSYAVAAADVDGDADLDLLFSRYNNQDVGVLLNGGTAVGLAPAVEAEAVSLYPNPATGAVRLVGAPVGPVVVLDAVGRTVRTATIQAGQAEATLSVEGLTPGLYLVRAGQQTRRLVVE